MKVVAFALTSALLLLALPAADQDTYKLKDGTPCPLEGTAGSDKGKALNRHKNRHKAPADDDIDKSITLAAMLAPAEDGDENRFDQEKGAKVQGYVIAVKTSKTPETCNCGATQPADQDTHIEIGLSKSAPAPQRVIVEVTPRLRLQMAHMGTPVDWSTEALREKLQGKWVEFTGWMLFDYIHADKSENTNPGNPDNFRATAWEVHPVTGISVPAAAPSEAELPAPHLAAFQAANARVVKRDPKRQEAIQKRLKGYLEGLSPNELKEKEEEEKGEMKPKDGVGKGRR
jgi:hypothetical protein